jgi:hypothetical protein
MLLFYLWVPGKAYYRFASIHACMAVSSVGLTTAQIAPSTTSITEDNTLYEAPLCCSRDRWQAEGLLLKITTVASPPLLDRRRAF